jgi:hypothetical protein
MLSIGKQGGKAGRLIVPHRYKANCNAGAFNPDGTTAVALFGSTIETPSL